ncbi:MAG TPA: APC family permease [Gemmatimonadaceae bacterium]|jgi:amino acid transporter|nr:APC family permease [Gemmatimonadaceae bacterium]
MPNHPMNRSAEATARPTLVRAVSRWQLVGLSINDVVGSGVYLLPAAAAALLGPTSVWAVVLAGVAVLMLVLCFAEASSHFEEPGGGYLYTREAFGRFIGFEVGWMTWLARVASVASLTNGLALAIAYLWPPASSGLPRAAILVATIAALTWVNVVGVKSGARAAVVLVIAKMLPLAFFVVVGVFFVDWSRAVAWETPRAGTLGQATLLLLFAYAGFENAPAAAGEYRNPRRDVPFALLTMIGIITVTYALVQLVALGTLPGLAESASPLAEAAGRFAGSWGALLLTVGAVLSIVGNIGNTTLLGPRYLYALGVDGFGPRALARVHPRYSTPANAIITQSVVALALALSGSFVQLAMLSVIARLTTYIGTAAAVPVLRRRFGTRPGAFRLPGGPTIPILALALSAVFLMSAQWENLVAGAIALVVGAGIYQFRRPPADPPVAPSVDPSVGPG